MDKLVWKDQEQIDREIKEEEERRKREEAMPNPEERIEMLETIIIELMMEGLE